MNRTQRALKKSYRDSENESRRLKNKMIRKRKDSAPTPNALFDDKANYNENVKTYAREEKSCRSVTRDYMRRAKNKNKEAATA